MIQLAKIYKAEMYFVDVNDDYDSFESILTNIDYRLRGVMVEGFNSESREINWYDKIDLNYANCPVENYRNYFK
jgi:hypothetical protein